MVVGTLTLEVGGQTEVVNVTAGASLIQAASGERSFRIDATAVESLPIVNRNFTSLAALAPGVDGTGAGVTRVGGGGDSNIVMDGVSTSSPGNNAIMLRLNTESLAEVRVLTAGYQAEFGRAAGVQITSITKSGTNRFHGSLYDVERDSDWNSNSRTNVLNGDPKTVLKERDFGFSIGGPIGPPGGSNKLREIEQPIAAFANPNEVSKGLTPVWSCANDSVPTCSPASTTRASCRTSRRALRSSRAATQSRRGRSGFIEYNSVIRNTDFYVQDKWKAGRRLTMDYGVRFVHQVPDYEKFADASNFLPDLWDPAAAPALYVPGCANGVSPCTGTNRQARNPITGQFLGPNSSIAIGTIVPGTGDPLNGLRRQGDGIVREGYIWPAVAIAPRLARPMT